MASFGITTEMSLIGHARIAVMNLDNKMITDEALREIREQADELVQVLHAADPMLKQYETQIKLLDEIARLNALLALGKRIVTNDFEDEEDKEQAQQEFLYKLKEKK